MAAGAFIPPKFTPLTDIPTAWRFYKDDMDLYFLAAGLHNATGERKVAILLYGMGAK